MFITTLTKKMAEELNDFLVENGVKSQFLHSSVKTLDRVKILENIQKGVIDVIVGVNLLREGLDIPEVSLVMILDADKEGFLRNETSLIQTIGRAARNIHGKVILFADIFVNILTFTNTCDRIRTDRTKGDATWTAALTTTPEYRARNKTLTARLLLSRLLEQLTVKSSPTRRAARI